MEETKVFEEVTSAVAELNISVDTIWVLIAAALVMFMQPGFAMVEAGFTRRKNTANILMKNLLDFSRAQTSGYKELDLSILLKETLHISENQMAMSGVTRSNSVPPRKKPSSQPSTFSPRPSTTSARACRSP